MKVKIWVLSTCVPGEPEPCLPAVYGSEAEAEKAFDTVMREEWRLHEDWRCATPRDGAEEAMPYPDDPREAQNLLADYLGPAWGQWQISVHTVEVQEECNAAVAEPLRPVINAASPGVQP